MAVLLMLFLSCGGDDPEPDSSSLPAMPAMPTMPTMPAMADVKANLKKHSAVVADHVTHTAKLSRDAINRHINLDGALGQLDAVLSPVWVHVLDAKGAIRIEVLAMLLIFACLLLDITFSALYPASSSQQAANVAEKYRKVAQAGLKEAAVAKRETENALLDAKAHLTEKNVALKKHAAETNGLSRAKDEAHTAEVNRAVDNAQIAQCEDETAEINVAMAAQKLVVIESAEARWESFQEWQKGLQFSLQGDESTMDKTDLKHYLQAPERKWKFAGKQHTPDDLDSLFCKMDKDGDGIVTAEEFMEWFINSNSGGEQ